MHSVAAQSEKLVREDSEFEKGVELGFDEHRQGQTNRRIVERGLNPTQDQRGCSIPFGLLSNFVPASRGRFY